MTFYLRPLPLLIIVTFTVVCCTDRIIIPSEAVQKNLPSLRAAFTLSTDSCIVPCQIRFTNRSENFVSQLWNFGNGVSSTAEDTVFTYLEAGVYRVSLTVQNLEQALDDTSTTITVFIQDSLPPLFASFSQISNSNNGTVPDSVCFLNQSINGNEFEWDFGDGTTINTDEDTVCHVFREPGSYKVQLTAFSGNSSATSSSRIIIEALPAPIPLPIAKFSITNDSCTAPCEIQFINESENSDSYEWDFGDGNFSNEQNPVHEYTEAGNYLVRMIALNELGENKAESSIEVLPRQLSCNSFSLFEIAENTQLFGTPTVVHFKSFSSGDANLTYNWDFGDGNTSQLANPNHFFEAVSTTTSRVVSLTITNGNSTCIQTDTLTFYNGPVPGSARLTYIDNEGRIIHASPFSSNSDSVLIGLAPFKNLGQITDMEINYAQRKIYVLTTDGADPTTDFNNPQIWACNPNGTNIISIKSDFSLSDISLMDLSIDPITGLIYSIGKAEDAESYQLLISEEVPLESSPFVSDHQFIENTNSFIDQVIRINYSPGVAYVTYDGDIPLIKGLFSPYDERDEPEVIIEGNPGGTFSGLTIDNSLPAFYVYQSWTQDIRKYDPLSKRLLNVVVDQRASVESIAVDKNTEKVFWTEVSENRHVIWRHDLLTETSSIYLDQPVNKYCLSIGTFN